ncbi:uncharacterized protein LOC125016764 isoform X2 [Mugil cephalus]|uniref:uncharacterized protein LOC125016764 isoform X2 n=1 Tax=Mugil cephalus TaxID=48193 RepID=UPI001FB774AF|nr:uncharacterized protein LOC125016764 isoform X2 [Mugil cephalus]
MKVAAKREEGDRKKKKEELKRTKKQKAEELLFHRKEDDETGPINRTQDRRREEESEDEKGGAAAASEVVTQTLYPKLPTESPPQYEETPRTTRSKGKNYTWSKTMGKLLSPARSVPSINSSLTEADAYPVIQVANPNIADNQPQTILVYRTWTIDDVKKAVEGVAFHKEDVTQFVQDIENVRQSYHLNGQEVQQVWMAALGSDWHYVRGNWDPARGGQPLPHNDGELTVRVRGLTDRTTQRFRRRANYTEIGRVKQKEDEPFEEYRIRMTTVFKAHSGLEETPDQNGTFQQQLKNALHAGSKDAVRCWVSKHYIGLATGTLDDYVSHALHQRRPES